jgi:iron complex outermembrane receptor protein
MTCTQDARKGITAPPRRLYFHRTAIALLTSAYLSVSYGAHAADMDKLVAFNITAQSLDKALLEFGSQAHVQIMFASSAETAGLRAPKLTGSHTPRDALSILLKGTQLAFAVHGDNVEVTPIVEAKYDPPAPPKSGSAQRSDDPPTDTTHLQQVIVTAERTREPLLKVPMSVTALSGSALERSAFYNLQDFAGNVAGVSLIEHGSLGTQVVIRGITSGSAPINSAVATYIDETPFTAVGANGALVITPDLDTFDMQRIEVLRGPQGTLYGADALGGLVKYVTNPPDPTAFRASVEAGLTSVYGGATGHDLHEMINVPLASNAALRLVGYGAYYPGYIDDPSRGLDHTNSSHFTGGRASLLFVPVPDLSIRLDALYQQRLWNDVNNEDVNPGSLTPIYGPLIQEKLISSAGQTIVQLYSANIKWDSPVAELLSATSYYSSQPSDTEYDPALNGFVSTILGGTYGVAVGFAVPIRAITQEFRLTSSQRDRFRWLAGGYFTNQRQNEDEAILPINPSSRQVIENFSPNIGDFKIPSTYKEYAGYANLDYDITRTVTFGVGGRYSTNRQTFHENGFGIFGAGISFGNASSESVTTYSSDLRWTFLPRQMVYARAAEGYAPGGPNSIVVGSTIPGSYTATRTRDYEAGIKSGLLDGRLTAQIDAFHILWSNIQLLATVQGFTGTVNGGTAQSDGFEWEFAYQPIGGLTANFNGSYTRARLTEDTPASVNGHAGDRLPGVPPWQGSIGVRYEHELVGPYSAFAGLNWQYTGSRYSDFVAASSRQTLPRFNIVNLQAGIAKDNWLATLYVKNVANEFAINYVQPESLTGGRGAQNATVYTPRTIGLTVTMNLH